MEICKVFREYGWDQAAGGNWVWDTVISWLIEAKCCLNILWIEIGSIVHHT